MLAESHHKQGLPAGMQNAEQNEERNEASYRNEKQKYWDAKQYCWM